MDATTQAAQVGEMWVLGAPPDRGRAAPTPTVRTNHARTHHVRTNDVRTNHVRDLALAVSAAVLLALGAGVALTGGLMTADGDGPTVVGTTEP